MGKYPMENKVAKHENLIDGFLRRVQYKLLFFKSQFPRAGQTKTEKIKMAVGALTRPTAIYFLFLIFQKPFKRTSKEEFLPAIPNWQDKPNCQFGEQKVVICQKNMIFRCYYFINCCYFSVLLLAPQKSLLPLQEKQQHKES